MSIELSRYRPSCRGPLQELWGLVGIAETALTVVSAMVVATALLGMVTMILTTWIPGAARDGHVALGRRTAAYYYWRC